MTLIELHENNAKVSLWREVGYGQNPNFSLKNIVPFKGTKMILFQFQCFGETVKVEHVMNIQFSGLTYLDELPKDGDHENILTIEYKDENYYLIKPSLHDTVYVSCSCPDMRFRFSWYNYKAKCWFGGMPKKYKRKTKTRPSVNPLKLPGFCKHVFWAERYLQSEGYMS